MEVTEIVRAEYAVLLHDAFVGGFHLGRGNHNGAGDPVALDSDKLGLVPGIEELVGMPEVLDPGPVDFIHHGAVETGDKGGQAIAFHPGENHYVLALLEKGIRHVVLEDLAHARAIEAVGGVEIEVEGLKNEAGEEYEAGPFPITHRVDTGMGEGLEGDGDTLRLTLA